ncbi:phosphatidylserine decarboxylase [Campylobacter majalis]|uniref:phosphatidylserine decarboxylase n=1 Tax=Campylobacter majalis TaxID=2790656 RepID=UPI003D69B916
MVFDREFSKIFGLVGKFKFYKPLQNFINKSYVKAFNIDMSEFWSPNQYESLNALFTREFIAPREFDKSDSAFISPCDGRCLSYGVSVANSAFSIKGMGYHLAELLGEQRSSFDRTAQYDFVNLYLSPRDYHHYHAPFDMKIKRAIYIPGRLYSVAKSALKKVENLYVKNERVVLECEIDGFILWLVFVGALNVGKIKFCFDERIKTNANADKIDVYDYENLMVKKGDRLGNFELGSTILIISQKDKIKYNLDDEQTVRFGTKIGEIV